LFLILLLLLVVVVAIPVAEEIKGKSVPQHTYGGARGERMYSSYSFTTSVI
jgi:hypothetical protein